jgi:hypothetical protein
MTDKYITSPLVSLSDKLNIKIEGSVINTPEGPELEIIPAFILRADWEKEVSKQVRFLYISLEDPKGTQLAIEEELSGRDEEIKQFDISLSSDAVMLDIWNAGKDKIPVKIYISLGFSEKSFTSKPINAFIKHNKKAEKALVKNYGDLLFSASPTAKSLLFIGLFCFSLWRIAPLKPGWMFYTQCISMAGCLPLVTNCKCFSFFSNSLKPMCMYWVPCHCVPWFM